MINQSHLGRKDDYLYRLSLKGIIINDKNEVLVVKEADRDFWDVPGGGMDHGETIKDALAREMYEEVSLSGDFEYQIIAIEDPAYLESANILQVRLIFHITPVTMEFAPGVDGDEIGFVSIASLKDSSAWSESLIYKYASIVVKDV